METASPPSRPLQLSEDQHATLLSPQNGSLLIQSRSGSTNVKIRWDQGQARLELQEAQVHVSCPGELSFHCERFAVQADRAIELQSQGTLRADAIENMELRAHSLTLQSTLGDILLRANDFVRALGEKILLNTDTCPEQSRRQAQTFLSRLLGHRAPDSTPSHSSRSPRPEGSQSATKAQESALFASADNLRRSHGTNDDA